MWDRLEKKPVRDFLDAGSAGETAADTICDCLNEGDLTLEQARVIDAAGLAKIIEQLKASLGHLHFGEA